MPHAMTNDIRILIDRFFDGETSREEERALYDAFRRGAVPDDVRMYSDMFLALGAVQGQATPMPQDRRPRRVAILRWTAGIAASIAVVVGIGFVMRIDLPQPQAVSQSEAVPQRIALASKPENTAAHPAAPIQSARSSASDRATVHSETAISPVISKANPAPSPSIAPSATPQTQSSQPDASIEIAKANILQAEQMYLAAIALREQEIALREQEEEAREREEQEQSYARKLNSLAKEQSESIISL